MLLKVNVISLNGLGNTLTVVAQGTWPTYNMNASNDAVLHTLAQSV